MKYENAKVGMKVQIKEAHKLDRFETSSAGRFGVVTEIECYEAGLNVRVKFSDGDCDWGNTSEIRKVKGDK